MTSRTSGRIVGALFLLAFVFYGSGSALIDTNTAAGAVLILLNSVDVVAIGLVAYPILKRTHPVAARAYLAARLFEAVMLGIAVVVEDHREDIYWFAMIGLSLGSLLFCRALLQARLVSRFLAVWGLIGYAVLAAGGILELLGYGVGLALSAPGGLFEITLGVLLVVRGFPAPDSTVTAGAWDRVA